MKKNVSLTWLTIVVGLTAACGKEPAPTPAPGAAAASPAAAATPAADEAPPEPAPEATPLPFLPNVLAKKWTGDLDGMEKRRLVRVLVPKSPLFYFVDKGREAGLSYEMVRGLDEQVNKEGGKAKVVRVNFFLIPMARDRLLPALREGRGDIVAGNLTVTPERAKEVDFVAPIAEGVKELVVTGPESPPLASLEDLSGREVHVRLSSSYAPHLRELNARFEKEGRAPVTIVPVDENLETEDILEMVGTGLFPVTVADRYLARFWSQVFTGLRVEPEVVLHEGGAIAWAVRKGSPKLHTRLDTFMKTHKVGTREGNVLINKYLKSTRWVKNARSKEDIARFQVLADYFRKYSQKYDFDWLLMTAQGYQESQLDQSRKSHVGAIGVMQVLPTTARDRNVNIPDITTAENNIHAGVKYMRFIVNQYFADEPMDRVNKTLFGFASYNAGPARVARLRAKAREQGLDPNQWFNNVELVAARDIGRETVQYVSNIFKYYVAYKFEIEGRQAKAATKAVAESSN
jgi:membrane-bound lytic murein transglycosylase MltF